MSSQSNNYSPSLKPQCSSDVHVTTTHQSQQSMYATSPPPPKTTSFHIREDCWSEDATFTLIKAWGDNFLQLNRGNLRQKHWQHVADAVNSRHANVKKNRRTDVQCKNRIDTLKKNINSKKVEQLWILIMFLHGRFLDRLITHWNAFQTLVTYTDTGSVSETVPARSSMPALPPPPSSVPVGIRSKRPAAPLRGRSFSRRHFSVMAVAATAVDGADSGSDALWSSGGNVDVNGNGVQGLRMEKEDGDPYWQFAEAIGWFAELYERVEEAKQRQMVELEKHRMQFTKDLELQRVKLLMESQVHFEKLQRSKTIQSLTFTQAMMEIIIQIASSEDFGRLDSFCV